MKYGTLAFDTVEGAEADAPTVDEVWEAVLCHKPPEWLVLGVDVANLEVEVMGWGE